MNDYKEKQQDLTELNADGNRERGRNGEDLKQVKQQLHLIKLTVTSV